MYGKLFEQMYDGTLADNWQALITFQQMIILCDDSGIIDLTPGAISRRTGIPLEHIETGIQALESEDPYSRTPEEGGRRIVRLDDHRPWGWRIVNHQKYKQIASYEDKKRADRVRIAAKREKEKSQPVATCRSESQKVADVAHTDTDTDTEKNSTLTGTCADKSARCPQKEIINLYNTILPELPRCKVFSEQYSKMLKTRWREDPERQCLEWWEKLFKGIRNSDFLMGKVNGFTADLTWIVRPKNFTKIVNGNYLNKTREKSTPDWL